METEGKARKKKKQQSSQDLGVRSSFCLYITAPFPSAGIDSKQDTRGCFLFQDIHIHTTLYDVYSNKNFLGYTVWKIADEKLTLSEDNENKILYMHPEHTMCDILFP